MQFDNGKILTISNAGIKVFPKRAILRIGMLLTGSEVSSEIRSQLLNICLLYTSGSRINTHQINNPLRWNEVTETAHWYGKGNASVVASNIR